MSKRLLMFVCSALLVCGCAKRQVVKPSEPITPQPQAQAETKEEPSVRFTDWSAVPQIKTIYFDYDSSDLSAEARATLKGNADYLAANPNFNVLVEGNCDERGTTEYNLALGQRRATAVREYYGQLGVQLNSIGTISYGEEKPLDPNHTEAAWAKNRRAETKVRTK